MKSIHSICMLTFSIIVLNISSVNGQNFYVSITGVDSNPGTEALPWRTVSKAARTLTAGQTVYIHGGIYNENVTVSNSGTAGNYITFKAYPNETPIIDGTGKGTGSWALFSIYSKNYINVSGLRLQNGGMGINATGNNLIIENNYIYNFSNPGITLSLCSNSVVRGNTADRTVYTSWGECITFNQCEYLDVCFNEVKNGSTTNNAGGEGIDVKSSKHVRVYGNVVHDLPLKNSIYIDSYDGLDYDIQVFNNKVYNNMLGIILSSEKGNDMEKVWVFNNIIYDIKDRLGLSVQRYNHDIRTKNYRIKNIIFENNTISSKGIEIDAAIGSDFILRNNIIYVNRNPIVFTGIPTNLLISNNLSNVGVITNLGSNGILADPQYVNYTLRNFNLSATSPAIDKAAATNVPFDYNFMKRSVGNGVDIGAIEYGSTGLVQLPPLTKPAFTFTKSTVSQSTDDGTEDTSTGVVTLASKSLTTNFTTDLSKIITALRFTNVTVPKGATILNARIKVQISANSNSDTAVIKINAENSTNSQTLTSANGSISSKPRTTYASYWMPMNATTGNLKSTPSLDFVVGELVSNDNWMSGNAMTFIFEYVSGTGKTVQFNSFDNYSVPAELSIEYTLNQTNDVKTVNGSSENPVVIYPNPASQFITIDTKGGKYRELSVFDVLGKNIFNSKIDSEANLITLDIKNWNKGIHFIQLQNHQEIITRKVLVN
ncbi:MAG: T9SS type A sorting domain-containing protein [Sulfuricurvum sp.]|nr:T9SS type A sorting domain-containing protein [Sulfuricurvum sp.]